MLRKNTVVIEVTDESTETVGESGGGSNVKFSLNVPSLNEEHSDDEIEYEEEGG